MSSEISGEMSKVGVHYDPIYELHDTGAFHPESAERYRVLRMALEGLGSDYVRVLGRRAKVSEILLAHEHYYHDLVYMDVERFADQLRTGDTAICEESYDVALAATGAVLNAVDQVMDGALQAVFCAIRPPGHHATATKGSGFCIFNHVAIAARYLQEHHGLKRIAILDWDVHHGNGTEEIFIEDPSVFYVSLHEEGIFPHTGPASETGRGKGKGATLNIPLPQDSTGELALKAWDALVAPAMDQFQPEFVLVSAGFDAREGDPVGGLCWKDDTFAELTKRAARIAQKWSQGRLVSALEGGYDPAGLAAGALSHVEALGEIYLGR
jgi:acetoin utilization deacetylase AcuC-like enzyme